MGRRLAILASAIFFVWSGTALAALHMSDLTVSRIQSTLGDANAAQIHITGKVTKAVVARHTVRVSYTFDAAQACDTGVQTSRLFLVPWAQTTTNATAPGRWSADIVFHAGTFSLCPDATGPLTITDVHLSVYAGPFSPPRTVEGKPLYYAFDLK